MLHSVQCKKRHWEINELSNQWDSLQGQVLQYEHETFNYIYFYAHANQCQPKNFRKNIYNASCPESSKLSMT